MLQGLTMADIFQKYLDYIEANKSKSTYVAVEICLRHFASVVGSLQISQINEGYINVYKRKRTAKGASNGTINKELAWLSGCLSFCRDRGVDVPQIRIEKLHHSRPIPIILEPSEVAAILAVATPLWRAFIGMLYFCGMRLNEARHIKWADIDMARRLVLIPKGKGSRPRVLPLPDVVLSYLGEIPRTGDYVFESPRVPGHPIRYADQAIKRLAKEAGVSKNVYAHLFRHSVASHMLEWANIRTIQSFLGHSEIQTTEWYTHLNVEHLRTASDQVAQGYGRPLSLVKGK